MDLRLHEDKRRTVNEVMCLSATTNNLASTACSAFKKATERHGIPSRVRGDQGIENVTLPDLWSAFGELTGEASCQGKVFTIKEDLFCLHMVFLPKVEMDLEHYVEGWNHHPIGTEYNRTPHLSSYGSWV